MATIETNWDEIPAEYRFTAVDKYGSKYAYTDTPILIGELWWPGGKYMYIGIVDCGFWEKSFRERPSVVSAVPTEASYYDVTVTGANSIVIPLNFTFYGDHNEEVGKLEWANGILEFSGKATESAKLFMDELQRQFHTAIEIEIERRVKELQSSGENDE